MPAPQRSAIDRLVRAARYQMNVCEDWLALGAQKDLAPAFSFVAAFSGFNALYWLASSLEAARRSDGSDELDLPPEHKQVRDFVASLEDEVVERIDSDVDVRKAVQFFAAREPVREMRFRQRDEDGSPRVGRRLRDNLQRARTAAQRVVALTEILYLVRCNLVHGAKEVSGTGPDPDLLRVAAPAMRRITIEALATMRQQFA